MEPGTQPVAQMVLSPRMPYALQEWRRMAGVAREAGFHVVVFRDPRVAQDEWLQAVAAAGAMELTEAPALDPDTGRACQVLNHSPATIVVRCGGAHPWPILGAMPDAAWHGLLQARRTELEAVSCR